MEGNLESAGTSVEVTALPDLVPPGDLRTSERRRSDRLTVSVPVRLEGLDNVSALEGAELVNMVELSLGGATLETASRPPLFVSRRMSLRFGEHACDSFAVEIGPLVALTCDAGGKILETLARKLCDLPFSMRRIVERTRRILQQQRRHRSTPIRSIFEQPIARLRNVR